MNATSKPHAPLTAVLVEDEVMFMELLRETIELVSSVRVIGLANSVQRGKQLCRSLRPDVLIIDLALAPGSGLDVAKELVTVCPASRVVVLSSQARTFLCPAWLHPCLEAVIAKQETFQELRCVLGRLSPSPRPNEQLPSTGQTVGARLRLLTRREKEVFGLLGQGFSSDEIGKRIGLTEQSVRTYRKRIARKLGTTGNELVHRAIEYRARLIEPPDTNRPPK